MAALDRSECLEIVFYAVGQSHEVMRPSRRRLTDKLLADSRRALRHSQALLDRVKAVHRPMDAVTVRGPSANCDCGIEA